MPKKKNYDENRRLLFVNIASYIEAFNSPDEDTQQQAPHFLGEIKKHAAELNNTKEGLNFVSMQESLVSFPIKGESAPAQGESYEVSPSLYALDGRALKVLDAFFAPDAPCPPPRLLLNPPDTFSVTKGRESLPVRALQYMMPLLMTRLDPKSEDSGVSAQYAIRDRYNKALLTMMAHRPAQFKGKGADKMADAQQGEIKSVWKAFREELVILIKQQLQRVIKDLDFDALGLLLTLYHKVPLPISDLSDDPIFREMCDKLSELVSGSIAKNNATVFDQMIVAIPAVYWNHPNIKQRVYDAFEESLMDPGGVLLTQNTTQFDLWHRLIRQVGGNFSETVLTKRNLKVFEGGNTTAMSWFAVLENQKRESKSWVGINIEFMGRLIAAGVPMIELSHAILLRNMMNTDDAVGHVLKVIDVLRREGRREALHHFCWMLTETKGGQRLLPVIQHAGKSRDMDTRKPYVGALIGLAEQIFFHDNAYKKHWEELNRIAHEAYDEDDDLFDEFVKGDKYPLQPDCEWSDQDAYKRFIEPLLSKSQSGDYFEELSVVAGGGYAVTRPLSMMIAAGEEEEIDWDTYPAYVRDKLYDRASIGAKLTDHPEGTYCFAYVSLDGAESKFHFCLKLNDQRCIFIDVSENFNYLIEHTDDGWMVKTVQLADDWSATTFLKKNEQFAKSAYIDSIADDDSRVIYTAADVSTAQTSAGAASVAKITDHVAYIEGQTFNKADIETKLAKEMVGTYCFASIKFDEANDPKTFFCLKIASEGDQGFLYIDVSEGYNFRINQEGGLYKVEEVRLGTRPWTVAKFLEENEIYIMRPYNPDSVLYACVANGGQAGGAAAAPAPASASTHLVGGAGTLFGVSPSQDQVDGGQLPAPSNT